MRHGRAGKFFEVFSLVLVLFWVLACGLLFIGSVLGETLPPTVVGSELVIRLWVLVHVIPELLRGVRLFDSERRPYENPTRRKRERPRREPWFRRAQRRRTRWKATYAHPRPQSSWQWDGTAPDWWDDWYRSYGRYKYLHVDTYARRFDDFCRPMTDQEFKLLMFGSHDLFSRRTECGWDFLTLTEPLSPNGVLPSTVHECFQALYVDDDSDSRLPLVFDSGATISVTPYQDDFIAWENSSGTGLNLRGVNSDTTVHGSGTVEWRVRDDAGKVHSVMTRAYYVPNASARLFSPVAYFKQPENVNQGGSMSLNENGGSFVFPRTRAKLSFWFDTSMLLPVTQPERRPCAHKEACDRAFLNVRVTDDENQNLTRAQKELLHWHYKLGHIHMDWVQKLMRVREGEQDPILPTRNRAASCPIPVCAACQYGKAHLRPTPGNAVTKDLARDGVLKSEHTTPGHFSIDQFVSKARGRLLHTYGKEDDSAKYTGGTIYVDEASSMVFVQLQVSLDEAETLRGKHLVEREALNCGIHVRTYRGDNGIFRSKGFLRDLEARGQTIKYSGVGAHHQNGVAERAIRTISECARTMLLHAMVHWPGAVSLELWPFAVDYAVYLWNHIPRKDTGLAPIEIFCRGKQDNSLLKNLRPFGCPVYVLDPRIHGGKKLPKWDPKSKRGQFLGMSKRHASTIGLIRNLATGSVTPQYHVVYDELFTTVPSTVNYDEQVPANWIDLLTYSRDYALDDEVEDVPELGIDWLNEDELREKQERIRRRAQGLNRLPDLPEGVATPLRGDDDDDDDEIPPVIVQDVEPDDEDNDAEGLQPAIDDDPAPPVVVQQPGPVRGGPRRVPRRNPRYYGEEFVNVADRTERVREFEEHFGLMTSGDLLLRDMGSFLKNPKDCQTTMYCALHDTKVDEDGLLDSIHPLAFAAKANAEDTPNFHQAMNSEDAEGFFRAMEEEYDLLESEFEAWEIVPRSIPESRGKNILGTTWAFKRKRYPDGSVRKLKARLCIRGDQQVEGVDYFETYAPVVAWSTVRLLMVMSVVLGLKSVQVDYTNAFVQAKIEDEIYCEMPRMFQREGYILRLKRNVYGLRQAPLNFFLLLKEALEQRGFVQSRYDPCLFSSGKVICLCYVDDCIFYSRAEDDIWDVISDLKEPKNKEHLTMKLAQESDIAGFLGIDIRKHDNGTIELVQSGLIKRILRVMKLEDSAGKPTPAASKPLGKDDDGPNRVETWSYPSVVGMMMYLSVNSRPDIAFAVHQCARFTHCPKRSHEVALKRIARYLKGTSDRGMIIRPSEDLRLDLYADADFAGLWGAEHGMDPTSVKSRTGNLITLGGTPIVWMSKLQSEISLSTAESEYISLSTGMRTLLPLRELLEEVCRFLQIERDSLSLVSTVWEDNQAALKIATAQFPNMSPRTKHIGIKYHWFRSHVEPGKIEVRYINTTEQRADIFTKGLVQKDFEEKRAMLMGW